MIERTMGTAARVAVLASAMLGGCAQGPNAEPLEVSDGGVEVAQSAVLARLQLSPTHYVEFREEALDEISVSELYHLDDDRGQPTYAELHQQNLLFAPAYEALAGKQLDLLVLDRLREVDARHQELRAERAEQPGFNAEDQPIVEVALATGEDDGDFDRHEHDDNIEKAHPCIATPAGYDWGADGDWWMSQTCDSQAACGINVTWAQHGWWRTRNYSSVGIAQDFCNFTRLIVRREVVQPPLFPCFGSGGIVRSTIFNQTIPNRHAQYFFASNSGGSGTCDAKISYFTRAEKASGPNGSRLGLVVNPKEWGGCPRGCSAGSGHPCLCPID